MPVMVSLLLSVLKWRLSTIFLPSLTPTSMVLLSEGACGGNWCLVVGYAAVVNAGLDAVLATAALCASVSGLDAGLSQPTRLAANMMPKAQEIR